MPAVEAATGLRAPGPGSGLAMERGLRRRGLSARRRGRRGRPRCLRRPARRGRRVLPDGKRGQVPGLADSKLLTAAAREEVYAAGRPAGGALARRDHPRRVSSTAAACTSATSRACAGRSPACRCGPSYVADRRLPGPRPGVADAGGVEGRPGSGLRRRGVRAGQGDPGPDHGGAARAVPGVRLRSSTRATRRRSTATPCSGTGRARSTGSPTSTWRPPPDAPSACCPARARRLISRMSVSVKLWGTMSS